MADIRNKEILTKISDMDKLKDSGFRVDIENKWEHEDLDSERDLDALSKGKETLADLDSLDYKSFIEHLGDLALDPKIQAAISTGLQDSGKKEDDAFYFSNPVGIPVRGCKPTQNEVVISKSLEFPLRDKNEENLRSLLSSKSGSPYTIKKGKTPMYIVVFNDGTTNYVIDGHHRWSQVHSVNPDAELTGIIMRSKEKDPVEVLKAVQLAILKVVQDSVSDRENVVLPAAEGAGDNPEHNLFACSEDSLKKYVVDNAGESFLNVAKETGRIEEVSKEAAADYIWKNVLDLRQNSRPIAGATNRELMPQTDGADNLLDPRATAALKSGDWKDELASGVINHAAPFESKKWIKTFEQFRNKK